MITVNVRDSHNDQCGTGHSRDDSIADDIVEDDGQSFVDNHVAENQGGEQQM